MSLYSVNDEGIARLRPIGADVSLQAACQTMATSTGWTATGSEPTGFIDFALMRSVLPHWSKQRLKKVSKVLVDLGVWEVVEDGYQFVGWDQEQRSKASRDEDAARQARCRTRAKVRERFVPKTAQIRARKPPKTSEVSPNFSVDAESICLQRSRSFPLNLDSGHRTRLSDPQARRWSA